MPNPFPGELYNLRDDLVQRRNLYGEKPKIVQRLKVLLERYKVDGRSTPGPRQSNLPFPARGLAGVFRTRIPAELRRAENVLEWSSGLLGARRRLAASRVLETFDSPWRANVCPGKLMVARQRSREMASTESNYCRLAVFPGASWIEARTILRGLCQQCSPSRQFRTREFKILFHLDQPCVSRHRNCNSWNDTRRQEGPQRNVGPRLPLSRGPRELDSRLRCTPLTAWERLAGQGVQRGRPVPSNERDTGVPKNGGFRCVQ